MSGSITFYINDTLKSIIGHSAAADKHSAPYGLGEPEPGLFLVKDSGIYLMSNADPGQRREDDKGMVVAYAEGYDPDKDEDVWEKARSVAGGDDFGEMLPLKFFQDAVANGAKILTVTFDGEQIALEYSKLRAKQG